MAESRREVRVETFRLDSFRGFYSTFFFFFFSSSPSACDLRRRVGHKGGKDFRMLNRTSNFDSASGIVRIVNVNSQDRFIFHLVHVRGKYFPE